MAASAAERIVIEDSSLSKQEQTLKNASASLARGVGPAQAKLGNTSFGLMNAGLAAAMNQMAQRTGELVAEASKLSNRMAEGVSAARKTFAECEEDAANTFKTFSADGTE